MSSISLRSLLTFVLLVAFASQLSAKDKVRDSVVKIHVTQKSPDFVRPWTKLTGRKTTGSGAIIAGKRILTNWHVVEYASQIFVQFAESSDKYPAVIVGAAPGMDLALLEMEDEEDLGERPALPIADALPDIRSTVNAYGYPMGGEDMSVTEGIISRVDFTQYSMDSLGLRIQVDAALNPGNSGGPAVINGEIIGLVFSRINQAENIGYLIPSEEINAFLTDMEDGSYDGKPSIFDAFQSAENKSLRARLKLPKETTGYVVRRPFRDEDYPLKKWDVVTHIGEHDLDDLGNVKIRDDLRLDFRYLIPSLANDSKIDLTVFREGEEISISVPVLLKRPRLLPTLQGTYPRHFILGPMCFTSATQDFASALGRKSLGYLTAVKSPLLYRQQDEPEFEGEELVVMSTRMFSHRMIKGYRNAPFGVVSHVNSEPVKSLQQFVELLRDSKEDFLEFEFFGEVETLVFEREKLIDATEGILEDEGIRYQYSKGLASIWEAE